MFGQLFLMVLCALNVRPPPGCRLNGRVHFGEPLPVLLRGGRLLEPTDRLGNVDLAPGDRLTLDCGAGLVRHPSATRRLSTADIVCSGGTTFVNSEWLASPADFVFFTCDASPEHTSERTNRTCHAGHTLVEVGYRVQGAFHALYETCFDEVRMRPLYSRYPQRPYSAMYQTRVQRLFFVDDRRYYGPVPVATSASVFSPWNQKSAVARLLGPVVDDYFSESQQLSRGHLAAKTDFVFAFGQRATFHYVNCAPQWTGFNGGNWNTLEVDLRRHVHEAGRAVDVFSGTHGVTQLRGHAGRPVELYLAADAAGRPAVPVPQYFYKVVYEPATALGTAFVGINNPHYNESEARALRFCEDVCARGGPPWLTWRADSAAAGFSFCCTVADFRTTVPHLPDFRVDGLFF